MTALLELRDKIKQAYMKNEMYLLPILKFLFAFIMLLLINGKMGYMTRVNNAAIVLIAAIACSFLPSGCIILMAALFTLMHMYALSMEIAVLGLVVYLLMFLLFFRFSPKDSLIVVITPVLCTLKIPYVVPIAMGLIGTPVSALSVGCGVIVYYLIYAVITNAATINGMNAGDVTTKLRLVIDALVGNKAMLVTVIAFAITVIAVYLIRRMSIDYSWTIAMVTGVVLNLLILLAGDLVYDTKISVLGALFGNILALAVAKVLEFFSFGVDYSRTEKVQFEDDEYYYYVKAVPKMTVSAPTKTVKHINVPRRTPEYPEAGTRRASERPTGRRVTTERTGRSTSTARMSSGARDAKSVTIGRAGHEQDDYEEL